MLLAILTTIHVVICLFLILVVLLQQGKGADLSVFGGGSTQAVFGARGAATLLHKLTVFGFIGFILTTVTIGFIRTGSSRGSVMSDVATEAPAAETEPAEAAGADAAGSTDPGEADAEGAAEEAPVVEDSSEEPAAEGNPGEEDGGAG